MPIAWMSGIETGDGSEFTSVAAFAVTSAAARTGAYGAAMSGGAAVTPTINAKQTAFRGYYMRQSSPAGPTDILQTVTGGNAVSVGLRWNSAGNNVVILRDVVPIGIVGALTGTVALNADGTFNQLEVLIDSTAGGIVQVLVNGTLDINTTHSTSSTLINSWAIRGVAAVTAHWDDCIVFNSLTTAGPGQIVARQGLSAGATYQSWTGSGTSGIQLAWSNTPFNAATSYSDSSSSSRQTMTLADIAATQAGHGAQIVSSTDTINAMRVGMIARASATSQLTILRRIGGTDTEAPSSSVVTTDAWEQSDIFTTAYTAIRTMEIGVKHGAATQYQQVEDMWLMIDYTPSAGPTITVLVPRLRMMMGVGR